jgi:death-on-curing protein
MSCASSAPRSRNSVSEPAEPIYPTYDEVLALHVGMMRAMSEGFYGVSADHLLASALERPRMAAQYEGADLIRQAAHLLWGLLKNHPFRQGNKRTAVTVAFGFLYRNGYGIAAEQDEVIELGYRIEDGGWDVDRVDAWLREHAIPRSDET